MSLTLYTGNRSERLVSELAGRLSGRRLSSPLTEEIIVVQSRGMQRWLSIELAEKNGIWANSRFPLPDTLVRECFRIFFSEVDTSRYFGVQQMTWNIMTILPPLLDEPPFAAIRSYLSFDGEGLRLYQLAERAAAIFNEYQFYRPDLLQRWESGGEEKGEGLWQSILWKSLVAGSGGVQPLWALKDEFCRGLKLPMSGFPERISLFGISYLPKFHLDILSALSRVTDITLFVLSPTSDFWADIMARKTQARLSVEERIYRNEGNPLLASLGHMGREFSSLMQDLADSAEMQLEAYEEPGEETLLRSLQTDMLHLQGAGADAAPRPLPPNDSSVQIHSCHSPLREVEVLHDSLLSFFETYRDLEPRDVLVLTPDIETYSPYISAVFGAGNHGETRIPFTVADRSMMNEGDIASAIAALLDLATSRLGAAEVFDLLSRLPVRRRFALDDDAQECIRRWIEKTGIRWGLDETDRLNAGVPSYRQNSWRAGLDRLLLGYAMPDEGSLYGGILPYDDIDASFAETLGIFASFVDALERLSERLNEPETLQEWRLVFLGMLDDFIVADADSEREYSEMLAIADTLGELFNETLHKEPVSPEVFTSWVRSKLEERRQNLGFMTGGVTFCAMLPMRSIPFRVICLLGMNDAAFPRQHHAPSFDLVSSNPRPGDRSLRNEDRYLFLEMMLSARDLLYISYVGQSVRDNSSLSPSVLVVELLDAIERVFSLSDGSSIADRLTVRHRLQAFSPAYFDSAGPLFSYSEDNFHALSSRTYGGGERPPFVDEPLGVPGDETCVVSLDELIRFYGNPAAFFLESTLAIRQNRLMTPLIDREPFSIEGLDAYMIREELLEKILQGSDPSDILPLFQARGIIPPSGIGERLFASMATESAAFAARLTALTEGAAELPPLPVNLDIGGFRLTGELTHIWPKHQLSYRHASMRGRERIQSWIRHLVLNAAREEGYPTETILVMRNESLSFAQPDQPVLYLENLLKRYREGLHSPLLFFPEASLAYTRKLDDGLQKAYAEALAVWNDNPFSGLHGEGSHPAVQRCFGNTEPFGTEFKSLALELLLPLMNFQETRS
ncbi:MAG TPA: exodeoxyribonuclease V subunit gamma [Chlorobium sp.]|uniref:RecBCD enzyme subunit RecC n=1 Tax=Chlorobium phaeovibrioides (strain DSM 265 / 1930) TaxID=290318 RepID=A4SEM0_CHLPM|nr:exodeoxyribonuclease V subunit gamma [Chlorobium sp.]